MNEELRKIIEQVEQVDPVVQDTIVKEFQRVVKVVANVAPRALMPWDEQFERFTMRARTVLHLAKEEAQPSQPSCGGDRAPAPGIDA